MAVSASQPGPNYGVALLDRLTKSSVGLSNVDAELKPAKLKENLGVALYELHILKGKLQEKALKLEAKCRDDERTFRSVIEQLREHLSELTDQFNKLDTQVHMVSGKLTHLGDQLDRKNLPRKRIEEARDLILEFYKFLGAGGGTFANVAVNWQGDENQVRSIFSLCLELPDDERFLSAKQRVTVANQQLESALLERFRLHCVKQDLDVMKRISDVLVNSKCHSTCVDILVGETLKGIDSRHISYKEVTKRLVSAEKVIMSVFARPENALSHLITTLVTTVIKPRMDSVIKPGLTAEVYLANLYTEYQTMDKLIKELSDRLTLITDPSQLSKLFRDLFADYLSGYMGRERECLVRHLSKHLSQFYESRGHQKRLLNTSGMDKLIKELSDRLTLITDPSQLSKLFRDLFADYLSGYMGRERECLVRHLSKHLSQFYESRGHQKRLLNTSGMRKNSRHLLQILATHQLDQRTFNLRRLQLTDTRHSPPNLVFFSIVREATSIFHFFSKTVDESLAALIKYCIACQRVVPFIAQSIREAKQQLDGKNLKNFLAEFGLRFNRVLVEHYYGFTFSDTGGFLAMQDVTAYREVAKQFGNPAVDRLFDVLLKLMNLMLIKPENVQQVTQDYLQSGIPRELLNNFIQLRADYKVAKSQMEVRGKTAR
ncbi:hypothetical protein AHF37_00395 [Paragonimus kellicotti]|nr:hypothetical protein AHF37_00395 [Paragonimus kellicotti]